MALITGDNFDNNLAGTSESDTLQGLAGNDVLTGGLGADALDGGAGFDFAAYRDAIGAIMVSLVSPGSNTGEAAGDTFTSVEGLIGSNFDDSLTGDAGDNLLSGGVGADYLDGGAGFDYADYKGASAAITVSLANPAANTGEAIGDTYVSIEGVRGSDFNDTLIGDASDNVLRGGFGTDYLNGGAGFDFADYRNATTALTVSLIAPGTNTGEAAGDTFLSVEGLIGSNFNDTLTGDANNNFLRGGLGADHLNGGAGFDYADYKNSTAGITVSLISPASNTGEATGDTFVSIEGVRGSDFNDTLIGDANGNFLRGGLGADRLDGGAGVDCADYFNSNAGLTVSLANPAANTGEAAGDSYISIEGLQGSAFNDTLVGDSKDNFLRGRAGADHLDGGSAGLDLADYHGSAAGLTVSLTNPAANTGEAAGDTYASIEGLRGSQFNDSLTGDAQNNVLSGREGADFLNGGAGSDFADYSASTVGLTASLANSASNTGEAAGDSYVSIEGLSGTNFNDTLIGNGRYDFLLGGLGADALRGGSGFDWADYIRSTAGLIVNLTNPAANTGEAAGDTFVSIEGIRGSNFNDTLIGNASNNFLRGGLGADRLDGGAGIDVADYHGSGTGITASLLKPASNAGDAVGDTYTQIEGLGGSKFGDRLTGDAGNNILLGRGGADVLDGGTGIDTALYDYGDVAAGVRASLLNPTINTGDAAGETYISIENLSGTDPFGDTLIGNNGSNSLSGLGGDDTLQGNGGADILDGGTGNDSASYAEKTTGVVVTLNGATSAVVSVGGVAEDTIRNIENIIGGSAADTLTGDALSNTFQGMAGKDIINGGVGSDTASYAEKAASVVVALNGATLTAVSVGGGAEDTIRNIENIIGGSAADTLTGDALSNTFQGMAGKDIINGGVGSDTASYAEKAASVVVALNGATLTAVSVGGGAEDTIRNIENIIGGSAADTLTGDALSNTFQGMAGKDTINGGAGSDTVSYAETTATVKVTLNGATHTTVLVGGVVDDTIYSVENVIGGSASDNLTGDAQNNTLQGLAGNDIINGGAGADTLVGGLGDDVYYIDNIGDRITEVANEGSDRVLTNVSYTLNAGAAVEIVSTDNNVSTSAINITGNEIAQAIYGNAGNNTLNGGLGNDTLSGLGGNDNFRFNTALSAGNVDTITDFTASAGLAANVDKIQLDDAIFKSLNPSHAATPFMLSAASFTTAAPTNANQHIIYDAATGALSYDDDGNGAHAAVQFATLSNHPVLTNADFLIV